MNPLKCPNCGKQSFVCDTVDIGVGEAQASPYYCSECEYVDPSDRCWFASPPGEDSDEPFTLLFDDE